jgi:hypothetical protein
MTNEIIFKTRVDTGTTSKDLASISTELGKIDQGTKTVGKDSAAQLQALNDKINAGGMSTRQLSKAVQEYMTIARDAGRDSPIGQQAIQDAAKLTDELNDLRNEINRNAHDGANMQAALQLGGTLVAGYGAAKGAMTMLGIESENLQETFVKLQAATATMNGLEQIRAALEKESFLMTRAKILQQNVLTGATAAYNVVVGTSTGLMKALRLAMLALPIFAIIAGVTLLITNFEKLTNLMKGFTDFFTSNSEKEKQAMAEVTKAQRIEVDKRIKANEAQQESIGDSYDFEIAKAKAAGKDTSDLERQKRAELKKTYQEQLKNLELSMRANIGNAAKMKEIYDEVAKYREKILKTEQAEEIATITETQKKRKEVTTKAKKSETDESQKQLERERLLRDYFIASIDDENVRKLVQMQEQHKREREELVKKYGQDTELIKALETQQFNERMALEKEVIEAEKKIQDEARKTAIERERRDELAALQTRLIGIQDDWNAEMEVKRMLWEMEMEEALRNEDLTENEKMLIRAKYDQQLREMNAESAKRELEAQRQATEQTVKIIQQGMNAIGSISDAVFANKLANVEKGSKEELEIQKKQFKANKAMQLSAAVIDGFKSITASLAQSPVAIGAVPNPAGIASLAFAAATSAANIAKIAATRFDGGSITAPTVGSPQIGAPDISQAQPNAKTTLTAGLVNQPNKVVVVDSEIKASMDSSQQIEVVSSFG